MNKWCSPCTLYVEHYVTQYLITKQASQRDERKITHFNETRNKRFCFQYVAATFFNKQKRTSSVLTKFNTKSVCCFSPLQTISLIYHLFSFPTTHSPFIALKATDEKDSFCLLPLVFDPVYKRLFLFLFKDSTLIMRLLLFFFHFVSPIDSIRRLFVPSAKTLL